MGAMERWGDGEVGDREVGGWRGGGWRGGWRGGGMKRWVYEGQTRHTNDFCDIILHVRQSTNQRQLVNTLSYLPGSKQHYAQHSVVLHTVELLTMAPAHSSFASILLRLYHYQRQRLAP